MDKPPLEPEIAWSLLQEGRAQLIDLRRADADDVPRVPGGRVIALDDLPRELVTLDPAKPVLFLSETGRKAGGAVKVLRAAGMSAFAIDGGIRGWLKAGLPTETPDSTEGAGPVRAAAP